jgi:hypothetical protein
LLSYSLAVDGGPIAVDDVVVTLEDTASAQFDVLANDIDPGDQLSILTFTQPGHGTLAHDGFGRFIYTPFANAFGSILSRMWSRICQTRPTRGWCRSRYSRLTDPPLAVADSASTTQGVAVDIAILTNDIDVDGEPLSLTAFTTPAHGAVTDNGNGTLRYTPAAGFTGTDTFSYTIRDASNATSSTTVTITVGTAEEAERVGQIRDQLNSGFGSLFPRLPDFSNLFDFSNSSRPDLNPPVAAENLNSALNIDDELRDLERPQLPNLVTMRDLIEALEALGFEVLAIEGGYSDADHSIPDTSAPGDLIRLRYEKTFADFHGTSPFDDSTASLLEALNPAADLNGNLTYDADLKLDLFMGLDSEAVAGSFFLLGQSAFRLDLGVSGSVTASFALPFGDLGMTIAGTASAALTVELGGASASQKYRVADIVGDPRLFLIPDVDGEASVELLFAVTDNDEPTAVTFGVNWSITIVNGVVSNVEQEIICPEEELFVEAIISLLADGFSQFGDPSIVAALNGIPVPLAAGPAGVDVPPGGVLIGEEATQPTWFEQVTLYLEQLFNAFDGELGEGAHYTLGDQLLGSAELRLEHTLDGAGITIGVISDGVDGLDSAQLSKDLPSDEDLLAIHPQLRGTGAEGVAMMEIIHDVAPAAILAFVGVHVNRTATGQEIDGIDAFIQGVRWLVEVKGATVVVDDMGFIREPFFEEGRIGAAIRDLMQRFPDVLFISSAGNYGQSHAGGQFLKRLIDSLMNQTTEHCRTGARTVRSYLSSWVVRTRVAAMRLLSNGQIQMSASVFS